MSDLLTITALDLRTRIGVTAEERKHEQNILVDIEITLDTRKAGESDELKDTVNYSTVASAIKDLTKTERKTIEKLAEDIAASILKHPAATSVNVTVTKFPKIGAECVSLTIRREK